jgi:cytochrome c peroxidase
MRLAALAGLVVGAVHLAACAGDPLDDLAGPDAGDAAGLAPPLPWEARLLPDPPEPADNPTTPEKVALGSALFHDPLLSADRAVACVTCHSQYWGLSDGLPRSIGVGGEGPAGLGRTGPNVTERNAQTLWNVAYRETLFWDGRAADLEEQVLGPLGDPAELDRPLAEVVADLREVPAYVALFEAAFPDRAAPLSEETVLMAIAAFQRTLLARNAPYDQYVAGDARALGEAEVRGMFLFAELGCAECHAPPRFERAGFEPTLLTSADPGRMAVTGRASDRGRFAIPTLRNARESGPYFHDGSVATLDEAVRIELRRAPRAVDPAEEADLVRFVSTSLIDRTDEPPRPREVPSGLAVPLDGFRVRR